MHLFLDELQLWLKGHSCCSMDLQLTPWPMLCSLVLWSSKWLIVQHVVLCSYRWFTGPTVGSIFLQLVHCSCILFYGPTTYSILSPFASADVSKTNVSTNTARRQRLEAELRPVCLILSSFLRHWKNNTEEILIINFGIDDFLKGKIFFRLTLCLVRKVIHFNLNQFNSLSWTLHSLLTNYELYGFEGLEFVKVSSSD